MKKLYDETHGYSDADRRRTQWYQLEQEDGLDFLFAPPEEYGVSFLVPSDYSVLVKVIKSAVTQSALDEAAQGVSETHWVFYTKRKDGDAIGDSVRFSILLREKSGQYDCDIMYSDFLFASAYDEIQKVKAAILAALR